MTTPNDTDTIVDEPEAPKKWTLPELRKFDGQLFIQNLGPTKITFHERMGDKSVDFELDPAGEPDAIGFLPKLALDMRGLQKLWMKGVVSISTDPEMEEQIMLLNAHAVGASEERMREIMGLQTPSNVHGQIEEHLCLVCGRRNPQTSVIERGRVLLSRRQIKDGTPPLCQEHTDQARFFVPRLVSDKGEEHWEFDSLKMNAVQR
jgi:hypothetical protein